MPKAERGGHYGGVPVWWAPSTEQEPDLPQLTGSGLPERIDLSETSGEVPAGTRAVGLFQLWGEHPGEVVVVGADGSTYSLDVSRLDPVTIRRGIEIAPVTHESVSPDGRYAVFVQERSLEVYDFDESSWTTITPRHDAYLDSVGWRGNLIEVRSQTDLDLQRYGPTTGRYLGRSTDLDPYLGPRSRDDSYGPIARFDDAGARGLILAGPVGSPDLLEHQSVEAVGAGGTSKPEAVLALTGGPDEGRWTQCCPVVGWLDESTVLFESRHEDARILAWRVGTSDVYRVSDIRGWTAGAESYVASFAAVDGSVTSDPGPVGETEADAELQGVPIWWGPDAVGEAELPWLDQSVGTHTFWRVTDIDGAVLGSSNGSGGATFADLGG